MRYSRNLQGGIHTEMEESFTIKFTKPVEIKADDIVTARFDVGLSGVKIIEVRLNDRDITDSILIEA